MKKSQIAFEYLVTYGWAIMTAIIAIGALAYFGFLNPSNLLPNKCEFGRQLECIEYRIDESGTVGLIFRNNFGKPINITDIDIVDGTVLGAHPLAEKINIPSGSQEEVSFQIGQVKMTGEKQELDLIITFKRSDVTGANSHSINGVLFTVVQ